MTLFDYGVILVIVLSALISYFRGAVAEVLALIGWIVSFWAAKQYAVKMAQFLPASLSSEPIRLLIGFAILFVATLILMTLFRITVAGLVKWVGLQSLDRGLGVLFGIASVWLAFPYAEAAFAEAREELDYRLKRMKSGK